MRRAGSPVRPVSGAQTISLAPLRERDGMEFLQRGREIRVQQRVLVTVAMMDIRIAEVMAEAGDVDLGIEKARSILETLIESEDKFIRGRATVTL
jgi:hypothetical protein